MRRSGCLSQNLDGLVDKMIRVNLNGLGCSASLDDETDSHVMLKGVRHPHVLCGIDSGAMTADPKRLISLAYGGLADYLRFSPLRPAVCSGLFAWTE